MQSQPDKGAAVPRFGEWDENDPASADNYTHIFNKVREEKISGTPNNITADPSYATRRKQNDRDKVCHVTYLLRIPNCYASI